MGSTVLVGAPNDESTCGKVHAFARCGGSWYEQSPPTTMSCVNSFGFSVAISSDAALVGAPRGDGNASLTGSTYAIPLSSDSCSPNPSPMAGSTNRSLGSGDED